MTDKTSIFICIFLGLISFYYFNKYQESKYKYDNLHKSFENYHVENKKMKSKIKDLETYKNDVSKTFNILDNELILINDNLKRRSYTNTFNNRPNLDGVTQNVSLLTPQLLSSLFNMNSEARYEETQPETQTEAQPEAQPMEEFEEASNLEKIIKSYNNLNLNSYDKFLLNN